MHRTPADIADDLWSDPTWQVDSAIRPCCNGIGDHTAECADSDPHWHEHSAARTTINASIHGGDITIDGTRIAYSDGKNWEAVTLDHGRFVLTTDEARALAAAILAALDQLDEHAPVAYTLT